ncbi:MAG TPA: amylo-alpha-1,6-glucosidase [Vicinamibacteria bacterium]
MTPPVRRIEWPGAGQAGWETLLSREWLVTNGLGGYASGTVCGVPTRRFHGLLIAALPAPQGRTMMLNHLWEELRLPDGTEVNLSGEERDQADPRFPADDYLSEFRLEAGLPVWTYRVGGTVLEKRLLLPHRQNTVHLAYALRAGGGPVRLRLRPALHFRPHEAPLGGGARPPYTLTVTEERYEFSSDSDLPPLRLLPHGPPASFTWHPRSIPEVIYRIEHDRGYDARAVLWSPGYFEFELHGAEPATLIASTERWETVHAVPPPELVAAVHQRQRYLLEACPAAARDEVAAELAVAADQFIITPLGRVEEVARARAAGDDPRSVIAGYHWFTDWGRDTMISLEGLTLVTGRHGQAGSILRTFARHVRDGLIPNLFPEGESEGLYHTADATLWFFHALDRYVRYTGDRSTLRQLVPVLREVVEHHLRGTRFGIGVDPADGLLRQGAEGYQLTWMDAKVDGWVVTPRRGKAVEINALWHNALRLLAGWLDEEGAHEEARRLEEHAERARAAFNRRFWYAEGGYLYDVVDGEGGDDPACRPNQLFAISLDHPVLDQARWQRVLDVVRERLFTPVGLRSLAPGHPDYKSRYYGDLRSRDAAYHQGTAWGWLVGPLVDAWLRVHPDDRRTARSFLEGFVPHLAEACIGTVSEIFDAEEPYTPRGCVAQAWSVAEVLRCWVRTAPGGSGARAAENIATFAGRDASQGVS